MQDPRVAPTTAEMALLASQRRRMLPFALSWWGFTFPLGSFVACSFRLGRMSGLVGVEWIGIACWGLLVVLWLLTLAQTLRAVVSGTIFRSPA